MNKVRSDCDQGNLNFDFLVGLTIFILAFAFVINSIPGIFMPYASNLVDLGSVTYRTSCILAEDPGWYNNTQIKFSYSDWEAGNNVEKITRVGLAVDKKSPNVLSAEKIKAMKKLPYEKSRDKLGLNGSLVYDYSLTVTKLGNPNNVELLHVRPDITNGANVDSLERVVLIREGEGLVMDCNGAPADNDLQINNASNMPRLEGNVTVRLINRVNDWAWFQNRIYVTYWINNFSTMPIDIKTYPQEYFSIYKNGEYVTDLNSEGCQSNDVVDIVVNCSAINELSPARNLTRINVFAMEGIPQNIKTEPPQKYSPFESIYFEYFNTPGIMRLEVW